MAEANGIEGQGGRKDWRQRSRTDRLPAPPRFAWGLMFAPLEDGFNLYFRLSPDLDLEEGFTVSASDGDNPFIAQSKD